jgi:hypothetical protein
MNNWIMIKTVQAYEFRVVEALDGILGGDFGYCPSEHRIRTISRRAALKKAVAVPLLPRIVFCSASSAKLDQIDGIRGSDGIIRDRDGEPEVIPSWQMRDFMSGVEKLRQVSMKIIEKSKIKEKPVKLKSFEDVRAELERRTKELVDADTGEIYSVKIGA